MGIYKSLDEAVQKVELTEEYRPQKQSHAIYAGYFEVFEKLTAGLSDQFEAIARLQHKQVVTHKKEKAVVNKRNPSGN
jgi:gluconokinase